MAADEESQGGKRRPTKDRRSRLRRAHDRELEEGMERVRELQERHGKILEVLTNGLNGHLVECSNKHQAHADALSRVSADVAQNTTMTREVRDFLDPEMRAKKDRDELRLMGKKVASAALSFFTSRQAALPLWIILGMIVYGGGHSYGWWAKLAAWLVEHWPH